MQNDVCLITSLVERWRSEKNTIHFTFGEMAVIQEDIYILTGLPIIVESVRLDFYIAVTKTWLLKWPDPELSYEQRESALDHDGVKLSSFREKYCILHPVGDTFFTFCEAILFPTKSNNVAHPRLISFLINLRKIYRYAWGAEKFERVKPQNLQVSDRLYNDLMLWLMRGCAQTANDTPYTRRIWPRTFAYYSI